MQVKTFTFNPFQENTYVVYGESRTAIIIDPGCYDRFEREQLSGFIAENDLVVKALWNTHCHIDHILGNDFVSKRYRVPLLAHRKELFTLGFAERSAMMYGLDGFQPSPEPEIFVEEGEELIVDDLAFKVIFGPGHCVGHIAFYNGESGVLIGGDIIFRGSFGRTDLPGGDMEVLKATIHQKIFTLPENTVILPGHGPSTTVGEEKKTNYILEF